MKESIDWYDVQTYRQQLRQELMEIAAENTQGQNAESIQRLCRCVDHLVLQMGLTVSGDAYEMRAFAEILKGATSVLKGKETKS